MKLRIILFLAALFLQVSCYKEDTIPLDDNPSGYPDWNTQSHSKEAEPNYAVVFPQDQVIRLDIVIDDSNWNKIIEDLDENIGTSSFGPGGRPPGDIDFDPVWVPCSIFYDGIEWYQVGIRVKGNSSLRGTYQSGSDKFSFKLDFDQFEDDYPELNNQRFYGFKQLNLKNNYEDYSNLREKVSSDLFRDFDLVSAQTAFCAVYIDRGQGEEYFGLYTLVEEVDNTVIKDQLGDDAGNLYKPESQGATFAWGTFNEEDMNKKNNEDLADYSDVQALYSILHDEARTDQTDNWTIQLESILDVEVFLRWLAANTAMQNWDTYGRMTHNYYLYQHHATGKLVWIPWDGNEALEDGKMGGSLSLELTEVNNDWPLIRYLIDLPEYRQKYQDFLKQFSENVFTVNKMNEIYDKWENLISPFIETNSSSFSTELNQLRNQVTERSALISDYLNQ